MKIQSFWTALRVEIGCGAERTAPDKLEVTCQKGPLFVIYCWAFGPIQTAFLKGLVFGFKVFDSGVTGVERRRDSGGGQGQ